MKAVATGGQFTGAGAYLGCVHPIMVPTANASDTFGYGSDSPLCGSQLPCYNAEQQLKWWGNVIVTFNRTVFFSPEFMLQTSR